MNNERPIGVFDSGVGGLSILAELQKLLPRENFIFLADQINFPYGKKSKSQLCKFVYNIANFLIRKRVKLVVVACNTATCHTIDFLRSNFNIPFVGTVPAIKPAAEKTITKHIGVISTPATSKSNYIANLIEDHAGDIKVINVGCAGLESKVEKGDISSSETESLLNKYLGPMRRSKVDVIVLGCTHYPFLKSGIQKLLGGNVKIIDSGKAIARQTAYLLKESASLNDKGGESTYFTTSDPEDLSRVASILMNRKIIADKITL